MSVWKAVGIPLACALVTIGIAAVNVWLGVLILPVMYSFSRSLLSR